MEDFKVVFDSRLKDSDLESGILATIRWADMMPYLRQTFYCKDDEKIVGITVSKEGIKAKIEYVKTGHA